MKAGTKIQVRWIRPEGDVLESATVRRVAAYMLPLPVGYVPVRFADGGTLMVHQSSIVEVA